MSKISLKKINLDNKDTNYIELDISDNNIILNNNVIANVIYWQRSRRRKGSAKIKQMHEISGSTIKPFKQKGTGNARQGSRRSVHMRGGRTCFGPVVRNFDYSLPKKIVKLGLSDVIKMKVLENKLVLVSNESNVFCKTSKVNNILSCSQIFSALFVYDKNNTSNSLVKSFRNIKNIKTIDYESLNVYDIIKQDYIILDVELLKIVNNLF